MHEFFQRINVTKGKKSFFHLFARDPGIPIFFRLKLPERWNLTGNQGEGCHIQVWVYKNTLGIQIDKNLVSGDRRRDRFKFSALTMYEVIHFNNSIYLTESVISEGKALRNGSESLFWASSKVATIFPPGGAV